jgi:hypothetical protein
MLHALLLCSDRECAEVFEAYGPPEELDALACDCGCSLWIVRWLADDERDTGSVEVWPLAA